MINPTSNEKQLDKLSKKFWLMMAFFYILFVVRSLVVEFPVAAFLPCVALMALLFSENEIKCLLISFIPLSPAFQFKYAIFICMFVLMLKFYRQMRFSWLFILITVLMVWELLHISIFDSSLTEFARGFAELACVVIAISIQPRKRINSIQMIRVLAISAVVAFSIMMICTTRAYSKDLFELADWGYRLGGVYDENLKYTFVYNPNGLGCICNIAIAVLMLNVYYKSANVFDFCMIAFFVFVGALTVSRTFLVCLALTIIFYIILQKTSVLNRIKILIAILCLAIFAVLIANIFFVDIINNYTDRFDVDDTTNGRTYLQSFYNEFVFSSLERSLFGIGIQDIPEKVYLLERQVVAVPHNGYQQIVVAWGIPGLILMMLFLVYIIVLARKNSRNDFSIKCLPLLLLLINILAGQFVTVSFKIISLLLIYEIVSNDFGETKCN